MNHLRTFMLLAALTALFVGIGYLIGGPAGMAIAFAIALVGNLISYWNADKIVLSMYRAQEVPPDHADARVRAYADDVREMAQRAGLPMPKVTLIDSEQPNAFATGRDPPTPPSPPPSASSPCSTAARSAPSWATSSRT